MGSIRSDDIRGRWGHLIDNTASFNNLDLSGLSLSGIGSIIIASGNFVSISGGDTSTQSGGSYLAMGKSPIKFNRIRLFDAITSGEGANSLFVQSEFNNGPATVSVMPKGTFSGNFTQAAFYAFANDYQANVLVYDVFAMQVNMVSGATGTSGYQYQLVANTDGISGLLHPIYIGMVGHNKIVIDLDDTVNFNGLGLKNQVWAGDVTASGHILSQIGGIRGDPTAGITIRGNSASTDDSGQSISFQTLDVVADTFSTTFQVGPTNASGSKVVVGSGAVLSISGGDTYITSGGSFLAMGKSPIAFNRVTLFDSITSGEGTNALFVYSRLSGAPAPLALVPNQTVGGNQTAAALYVFATDYYTTRFPWETLQIESYRRTGATGESGFEYHIHSATDSGDWHPITIGMSNQSKMKFDTDGTINLNSMPMVNLKLGSAADFSGWAVNRLGNLNGISGFSIQGGAGLITWLAALRGTDTGGLTIRTNPQSTDASGQTLNFQTLDVVADTFNNTMQILPVSTTGSTVLLNNSVTLGAGASGINFSGLQMLPTFGSTQVVVWVSGTNVNSGTYRAISTANGQIIASGTEAVIVMDAAISGAGVNGIIEVKPGQYIFNSGLNLVNRTFYLRGESWRFTAPPSTLSGNTIFKKNFSGGVLLNMVNSSGTTSDQQISNLAVVGDDTGTGIDWFFTAGNYGEKLSNVFIQDFDIGLRLRRSTYIQMHNVMVNSCPTYGIYLDSSGASAAFNNTLSFFGGFSLNCGHNVFATRTNDVQLYSMKLEGYASGAIYITSAGNAVTLIACSMEVNGASGLIAVEDWGNNNAVISCRFDSNVEYTAFALRSGCRNFRAMGNFFQFNASGVTCHIIGTSGACSGSMFEGNTKGVNTPGIMDWQLSGCAITSIGNSDMYDTTFNQSGWIYVGPVIHSGSATFAGPVTISGTTNLQAVSGFNWTGVFTSGGVSGGSGASFSGMIPQGYISLQVSGGTVKVPFFN